MRSLATGRPGSRWLPPACRAASRAMTTLIAFRWVLWRCGNVDRRRPNVAQQLRRHGPCGPGCRRAGVPTAQRCFIVQEFNESEPGDHGVLETTNGGTNWHFSTDGPQFIACPSSTHCIGVGPVPFSDQFAQYDWTTGGGWVSSTVTPPANDPITCASQFECFLPNTNRFYVTRGDEGASWHLMPFQRIANLACVDDLHCLACIGARSSARSTADLMDAGLRPRGRAHVQHGESLPRPDFAGIVESANGGQASGARLSDRRTAIR